MKDKRFGIQEDIMIVGKRATIVDAPSPDQLRYEGAEMALEWLKIEFQKQYGMDSWKARAPHDLLKMYLNVERKVNELKPFKPQDG